MNPLVASEGSPSGLVSSRFWKPKDRMLKSVSRLERATAPTDRIVHVDAVLHRAATDCFF